MDEHYNMVTTPLENTVSALTECRSSVCMKGWSEQLMSPPTLNIMDETHMWNWSHVILVSLFMHTCTLQQLHADKALSKHTWVGVLLLQNQGTPILYAHFCSVTAISNVNSTGMIARGAGQEHEPRWDYVVPIPDSQFLGLETVDRYLYALDTFAQAMYQTVSDITSNTSSYNVSVRPRPSSGNTILEHVYFWTASTKITFL